MLIAPGYLLLSRRELPPRLLFPASVVVSTVPLAVIGYALYLCKFDLRWIWLYTAGTYALLIRHRRRLDSLLEDEEQRDIVRGLFLFSLWTVAASCLLTAVWGGDWNGDWVEHFRRAMWLLHDSRLPDARPKEFLFTERPPLVNLLAAELCTFGGSGPVYQIAMLLLGSLLLIGAYAVVPASIPMRIFLPFFALHPVVFQHDIYLWTRPLTAFFTLSAAAFFIRPGPEDRGLQLQLALLSSALAILCHYSALVWLLPLAAIAIFLRSPLLSGITIRQLSRVLILPGVLLTGWFASAIASHGSRDTFGRNVFARGIGQTNPYDYLDSWVTSFAALFHPYSHEGLRFTWFYEAHATVHAFRDLCFYFYQNTVIGTAALVGTGALAIAIRGYRSLAREGKSTALLIAGSVLITPAVYPLGAHGGFAHVTMLPAAAFFAALTAHVFLTHGVAARRLLLTLFLVDFCLGIALSIFVQHRALMDGLVEPLAVDGGAPLTFFETLNVQARIDAQFLLLGDLAYRYGVFFGCATAAFAAIIAQPLFSATIRRHQTDLAAGVIPPVEK